MTAVTKTTKTAKTADATPVQFPLGLVDESGGVSTGPFQTYVYLADAATGNILSQPFPFNDSKTGYVASGLTTISQSFAPAANVTITIAAPCVITILTPLAIGTPIQLQTTGALPSGLTAATTYWVSAAGWSAGSIQLAPTYQQAIAGTGSIGTSGTQSGTQTITSTISPYFVPLAGRSFNITLSGTFSGTVQLERSFDSVSFWPITNSQSGTPVQIYKWTAPASEQATESQVGVYYRLNCTTYTSGTFNYIISQ